MLDARKYSLNKWKEEQCLKSSEIWELKGDLEVFLPNLPANVEQTSTDHITGIFSVRLEHIRYFSKLPLKLFNSWAQTLSLCNSEGMAQCGPLQPGDRSSLIPLPVNNEVSTQVSVFARLSGFPRSFQNGPIRKITSTESDIQVTLSKICKLGIWQRGSPEMKDSKRIYVLTLNNNTKQNVKLKFHQSSEEGSKLSASKA